MTAAVVSLKGVGVVYGAHPALIGVDLEVAPGERVALVGPSGAGKTTVLNLCTGAVVPATGAVSVLGCDIGRASPSELRTLRRRVGTVYQQLNLVGPLQVVHNVNAGRLGSWSTARSLRSLVRPLGVESAREALAEVGIADKIHERTDRLSGGEQQRVALARVLVQRPDLLLADEPVASLDPARAEEVMDLLGAAAAEGRTLLVSLHDFDLARRRCDRVIGLRAGRVVFDLPAADATAEVGTELYRIGT